MKPINSTPALVSVKFSCINKKQALCSSRGVRGLEKYKSVINFTGSEYPECRKLNTDSLPKINLL